MAEQVKQQPQSEFAKLQQEYADLRARLAAMESKLNPSPSEAAAALATDTSVSPERKAWLMLSAQEKSQLVVDEQLGKTRGQPGVFDWEVSLEGIGAKGFPVLRIPAHSEVEATGLYNRICGITLIEPPNQVIVKKIEDKTQAA